MNSLNIAISIYELSQARLKQDSLPPIKTDMDAQIHENAATSEHSDIPEPTPEEAQAGDYEKAPVQVSGLKILIENPYGTIRSGIDDHGNEWRQELQDNYGEIVGTEGADNDPVDVFIAPHLTLDEADQMPHVHVVDQINPYTGDFDEHKVVIGYDDPDEAKDAYLSNYEDGWQGLGHITQLSTGAFKTWLRHGNTTQSLSGIDAPQRHDDANKWITINGNTGEDGNGGTHVELDEQGNIVKGMGGKFTGKNIKELGGTKKFTQYETNAEREAEKNKSEAPLTPSQKHNKIIPTPEQSGNNNQTGVNEMNKEIKTVKSGNLDLIADDNGNEKKFSRNSAKNEADKVSGRVVPRPGGHYAVHVYQKEQTEQGGDATLKKFKVTGSSMFGNVNNGTWTFEAKSEDDLRNKLKSSGISIKGIEHIGDADERKEEKTSKPKINGLEAAEEDLRMDSRYKKGAETIEGWGGSQSNETLQGEHTDGTQESKTDGVNEMNAQTTGTHGLVTELNKKAKTKEAKADYIHGLDTKTIDTALTALIKHEKRINPGFDAATDKLSDAASRQVYQLLDEELMTRTDRFSQAPEPEQSGTKPTGESDMNTYKAGMKDAQEKIDSIEEFYRGQKNFHAGERDEGKIFKRPSIVNDAIEFFDDWKRIEEGKDFEILEKDGVKVRYEWNIPVELENYPYINDHTREKFSLI